MKKHRYFLFAACAALAGCGLLLWMSSAVNRPFAHLNSADLASVTVRLSPPDKTLLITEPGQLVEYLKDTVIYQRDDSYQDYCGQAVTFSLTMADGSQTSVMAFSPFLVIDGVGYRTKHEPCEALNRYANKLLNDPAAPVILEDPPALAVVSGDTSLGALLGSYQWQRKGDGDSFENILSDSPHPLDCGELLSPLDTGEQTAVLRFAEAPDEILNARCWSEADLGSPDAVGQPVVLRGNEIELQPGGYIYEVHAAWAPESGYGGTASYSFYVKSTW